MNPPTQESDARSRQSIRIASTALFAGLAVVVACLGVTVALVVITSNRDAMAVLGGMTYLLGAFGVPVATGVYLFRHRHWDWLRAVRFASILVLLVNAVLLPIPLAVFSM